jgi:insulysin
MAHFIQHMLFKGNEKYPNENEFSIFIQKNGGTKKAWTSIANTNYHFDCSNEAF